MGNKKTDPNVLRQILQDLSNSPDRDQFKFKENDLENFDEPIWSDLRKFLIKNGSITVQCNVTQIHGIFRNDKNVREAWGVRSPPKRITKDPFYKESLTWTDDVTEAEENEYTIPPFTKKQSKLMEQMDGSVIVTDPAGNKMSLAKLRHFLSKQRDYFHCEGAPLARRFISNTVIDLMANRIFKSHYKMKHFVFPTTFYPEIHTKQVRTKKRKWVDENESKGEELPQNVTYRDKTDYDEIKSYLLDLNENPMEKEVLFICVTLYNHSTLLVIYPAQRVATYHDGTEHLYENADKRIEVFWQILDVLHEHFLGKPCTGWTLRRVVNKKGSVQRAQSDCVLVTLWTMELVLGRHPILPAAFAEESMINYRSQVLCDLAHGKMVWQRPQPRQAWPPGHFLQGEDTPRPIPILMRTRSAQRALVSGAAGAAV